jgi:nucleotide-binding universal stress UspA family protein
MAGRAAGTTAPEHVGLEEGLPVERSAVGRRVLVPVANPASIPPLLTIAARLAVADEGSVVAVTSVRRHATADERAHAWQTVAAAEALGHELGIEVTGRVVDGDHVAEAVLRSVEDEDASLALMGWRGRSSTSDVFGTLIDTIVGRSTVPLAVVRLGTRPFQRVLLPVSADHLLPGGDRGLCLAVQLAERLATRCAEPTTVLRTGTRDVDLPPQIVQLGDRVHHDPRRTDQAVGAFARAEDLVVAAVAPTVTGLRAATTHLAWAAPDATLLVAVDVGRPREVGLDRAVDAAGAPAPPPPRRGEREVRIVVTVRLPGAAETSADELDHVLRGAGRTDHLMAWWPAGDPHPHVRATVSVRATSVNAAIAAVMIAVHEAPAFRGAEISYDVDRGLPDRPDTDLTVERSPSRPATRG